MTQYIRPFVVLGTLMILLLFCAGCTQGPAPVVPADATGIPAAMPVQHMATKEEMVAFVEEAVNYAHMNGKEKALAEFSNPKGSFFRGELYIYAYDYDGTTIAHPVNPEKIGVNRLDEKDAEGNLFIRELMDATTDGTGFVTYYYINPAQNNQVEKKLGYAMQVDEDWWLGSGIYFGPADTQVTEPIDILPEESVTVLPTSQ